MVAIMCWYVWWERRQSSHGEKVKEVAKSAMAIGAFYSNFVAACSPKAKIRKVRWKKLLHEFAKLNVDASFDEGELRGATGVGIRHCNGSFIVASSRFLLAQTIGCNKVSTALVT
jgi:hypothetical protein